MSVAVAEASRRRRAPYVITGKAADRRQYAEKYQYNSVAWAYDVGRVGDVEFKGKKGLDPKQEEILDATDRHTHVAVAGAKGVGKDFLASIVATKFVATFPFARVPCASVTGGQMRGALWPQVQERISQAPILQRLLEWTPRQVYARGVDEKGLSLAPRWRIYLTAAAARKSEGGGGSSEAEGGAGDHADNLLLIVTEASGWSTAIWRARLDTLTGKNNRAFVNGNPLRPSGPFFDVYHKPLVMQHWKRFHIRADESRAVEPGALQRMIDTYGESSAYVQANGFGRFPTSGSERSIFSHAEVSAAFERVVPDDPDLPLVLGVDVAREGFDRTVVHTRRGMVSLDEAWMPYSLVNETALLAITEAYRWHRRPAEVPIAGETTGATTSGARTLVDRFRTIEEANNLLDSDPELKGIREDTTFVVDDSGVGGGVTDVLKMWGWRKVVPMNNGWSARKPQFYASRGAELWMVDAKAAIKECRLPYSDELLTQLTQREYHFTGKKQQRTLLGKAALKAMGIDSPDHADAFVLAYAQLEAIDFTRSRSLVRSVGRRA